MNKYVQRGVILCGYLLLIALCLGFPLREIFNLKELFLVVAGCALLTLPYQKEGKSRRELLEIAGSNGLFSSYMVSFVLLLAKASRLELDTAVAKELLLSLRPILYGFVLLVLLKRPEEKRLPPQKPVERSRSEEETNEGKSTEARCRERGLTAREAEIAKLVLLGLTNKEIAESLYIAESTVKKHLSSIFDKFEVKNREQLKNCFRD